MLLLRLLREEGRRQMFPVSFPPTPLTSRNGKEEEQKKRDAQPEQNLLLVAKYDLFHIG